MDILSETAPSEVAMVNSDNVSRSDKDTSSCIVVGNICIRYGAKKVLEDVSLRIPKNAVTALIGPSGCGKTSFLCCLNRLTDLMPDCHLSGCVRFEWAQNLSLDNPVILRRHVGMLFQRPNPFPFSIWRNLELPLRQHGVTDKKEIAWRIESTLFEIGLWDEVKDRLNTPALSLSSGQQQRLCLARALILDPTVLLMDEPCSALDPMSTRRIEEVILRLVKTRTVVLVTHNLAQAKRVADFVAVFWNDGEVGRLIEYGPAKNIFENPTHDLTQAYLVFG